jgi:glucosamine kinase
MSETGFLGIDCGGTSCRVAWQVPGRRVDYIGAGGNFTTDPDVCASAIVDACQGVADKAGVSLTDVCAARAYIGAAGVISEADGEALAARLPMAQAVIEDDRRAMEVGALSHADGFVAGLGTGSFFARRTGDTLKSVGGWGLILSDEASGAWLGRSLLGLALPAHDGRLPASPLTDAILDEFGGPEAIVSFAKAADPREFARLAKGLAGAAEAGDANGRVLMQSGADWIAEAFYTLGWMPGDPICVPGDLGAAYHSYLPEEMQRDRVEPMGKPVDGALSLAMALS